MVVGNIPEVVISTARGRSLRAVLITNELQPRVNLFVAMGTVVADNAQYKFTQQAGIYCASVSSAVAGTAYVVSAEAFILWLPRLQMKI